MNILFSIIVFFIFIVQLQAYYQSIPLVSDQGGSFISGLYNIECEYPGYVLASDLIRCVNAREELGMPELGNCIRLGEDGYCQEGRESLTVIDKVISYNQDSRLDNYRCAQANSEETMCLYPRFGYALDLSIQHLLKNAKFSNCALYDAETIRCLEYHQKIIPSPKQGAPVLRNSFINSQKVDCLKSEESSASIICKDGYDFIGTIDNPVGCISRMLGGSKDKPIPHCKKHIYNNRLCKMCQNGFALHKNKHSCLDISVKNCIEYDEIQGEKVCWTCKPFYRVSFGKCIKIENCTTLSQYNPNRCHQKEKEVKDSSIIEGYSDLYWRQIRAMLERQKNFNDTTYCSEKSTFLDYTLYLYGEKGINHSVDELRSQFDMAHPLAIEFIKINHLIMPTCTKRQNYPIEGCSKYHIYLDSCEKCEKGYFLENQAGQFTVKTKFEPRKNHFNHYRYICKKTNPQYVQKEIQNCHLYSPDGQTCIQCKEGYFEDGNICLEGIDENCLIYLTIYQCLKCKKGFINISFIGQGEMIYSYSTPHRQVCFQMKNLMLVEIKEVGYKDPPLSHGYYLKDITDLGDSFYETNIMCGEPSSSSMYYFTCRRNCTSIYTSASKLQKDQCVLSIPPSYYVNYTLVYERYSGRSQPLAICSRMNCVKCEYQRCLQCKDGYSLDSNFQCQKVCVKNIVQDNCIQLDQIEEEISNEIEEGDTVDEQPGEFVDQQHNQDLDEELEKENGDEELENENSDEEQENENGDELEKENGDEELKNDNGDENFSKTDKDQEQDQRRQNSQSYESSSNWLSTTFVFLSGMFIGCALLILYRYLRQKYAARNWIIIDRPEDSQI